MHVSSSECNLPEESPEKYPKCGSDENIVGFGNAGGGFGHYECCAKCGKMLSKVQVDE